MNKNRIIHYDASICYLKKGNQVLMLKFNKKWGHVYCAPGGKFESGETPLDCILREFREETGLTLINPKLQGISYWCGSTEGIIFVFTATDFEGELKESDEGHLEWIPLEDLDGLNQFEQNKKFTKCLFKDQIFEGKFLLDDKCNVLDYEIRTI